MADKRSNSIIKEWLHLFFGLFMFWKETCILVQTTAATTHTKKQRVEGGERRRWRRRRRRRRRGWKRRRRRRRRRREKALNRNKLTGRRSGATNQYCKIVGNQRGSSTWNSMMKLARWDPRGSCPGPVNSALWPERIDLMSSWPISYFMTDGEWAD